MFAPTSMITPSIEIAQTHADQLRREADTWRERRQARRGTAAAATARRGAHRAR
jgi:hypothetical protein